MPEVTFVLSAEQSKAVQAYLAVAEAQGKVVEGHRKIVQSGKQAQGSLGKVGATMEGELAGFKSAAVGMLSIATLMKAGDAAMAAIHARLARSREFSKETRPLLGEFDLGGKGGDQQVAKIKKEVIDLSNTWGKSTAEIAAAKLAAQRGLGQMGAGTVDESVIQALKLSEVMGTELPESIALTVKAYQAWKDQLGSTAMAGDRLLHLAKAIGSAGDPGEFLAGVSPDALAAKVSFDEVTAAADLFTRQGGRTKESLAAMKAMMNGVKEATQQGLVPATGTLTEKLAILSRMDPALLKRLFGEGAVNLIQEVMKHLDELEKKVKELSKPTGRDLDNQATADMRDVGGAQAAADAVFEQGANNKGITGGDDLMKWGGVDARRKAAAAAMKSDLGPSAEILVGGDKPSAPQQAARAILSRFGYGSAGLKKKIEELRKGGRGDLADYIELSSGNNKKDFVDHVIDRVAPELALFGNKNGPEFGENDWKQYMDMKGKFGANGFGVEQYKELRKRQEQDKKNGTMSATQYLRQFGDDGSYEHDQLTSGAGVRAAPTWTDVFHGNAPGVGQLTRFSEEDWKQFEDMKKKYGGQGFGVLDYQEWRQRQEEDKASGRVSADEYLQKFGGKGPDYQGAGYQDASATAVGYMQARGAGYMQARVAGANAPASGGGSGGQQDAAAQSQSAEAQQKAADKMDRLAGVLEKLVDKMEPPRGTNRYNVYNPGQVEA